MECPNCHGKTKVVDTAKDDENVYRIRQCIDCGCRYGTREDYIDIGDANYHINFIKGRAL